MKLRVLIFSISILLNFQTVYSQQDSSDSLVRIYLNEARQNISEKNYTSANNYFKKIFNLKTTLPDEAAYFYGVTLLNLKSYVKSKAAFEKYISLTGENGEFYNDSKKFLSEAESFICKICNNTGTAEIIDTCDICTGAGKVSEKCESCKTNGKEICMSCGGKGVITSKTSFGASYQTCGNCQGQGFTACSVCNGTKKKMVFCLNCKGKGIFRKKVNCSHK
jgi:hypothetical protein